MSNFPSVPDDPNLPTILKVAEKMRADENMHRHWQLTEGFPDDGPECFDFFYWCLNRAEDVVLERADLYYTGYLDTE